MWMMFVDSIKLSLYRKLVGGSIFITLCFMLLSQGCQSVKFDDSGEGTLILSLSIDRILTRADPREIPDTNNYTLIVKSSGGDVVYSGRYGERPAKLTLSSGSYDVTIFSKVFEAPEFNSPVFGDSKTVIITTGQNSTVTLLCKQINGGVKLVFGSEILSRYGDYNPVFETTKGNIAYPYTETRYLYFMPGSIKLSLSPKSGGSTPIFLFNRSVAAGDMVTFNLDATKEQEGNSFCKVVVDTTANWSAESFIVGQSSGDETGNDGSSREKAVSCRYLSSHIGKKDFWVYGYVVGGDMTTKEMKTAAPFTKDSHIAISYSPSVKERSESYGVNLSNEKQKLNFSLVQHPELLGKKVYIKGFIKDGYFGSNGINPTAEIIAE